jgi:hypothetical protein
VQNPRHTRNASTTLMALVFAALATAVGGCAAQAGWHLGRVEAAAGNAETIAADPVAYLEDRLEACRKLRSYTTMLYRQERLGQLIPQLRPTEKVLALYRAKPLSVRFIWLDEDSKYLESVYVADQNDGKQLILERRGLFGGKGNLWTVDPQLAVALAEAKYPTTDFGLLRLMEKSLDMPADPAVRDGLVTYCGLHEVDLTGQQVHLFEIRGTQSSDYPLQELMIDAATGWPAGTRLWLDEDKTHLDAMYLYTQVRPNLPLSPESFTIEGPIPADALPAPEEHAVASKHTPGNH